MCSSDLNGLVCSTLGKEARIGTAQAVNSYTEGPKAQVSLVALPLGEGHATAKHALKELERMHPIPAHLEDQIVNAIKLAFETLQQGLAGSLPSAADGIFESLHHFAYRFSLPI